MNLNHTIITEDLQITNLFNKYISQSGSALRQQIPNNSRHPLTFFDEADKNASAFGFYESIPDEFSMLISKIRNKGSAPDKIPTLIYKK